MEAEGGYETDTRREPGRNPGDTGSHIKVVARVWKEEVLHGRSNHHEKHGLVAFEKEITALITDGSERVWGLVQKKTLANTYYAEVEAVLGENSTV